jgi:lipopolysaccharide biosynthesis glycosyltransferase
MGKNSKRNIQKLKILRAPSDNGVCVTLACDSNYEAHLWVTISSIVDNLNTKRNYYIYILDGGIRNKMNFYEFMRKNKNFHIEFIDMSLQFLSSFESRHVKRAAYYRLAVFSLFRNFKKLIYIDADSYVLSDVAELFDIDLGNKNIAGAKDSITY